jgi:hypothetical protein
VLEQSLADRAKDRADLLKNAVATQLWVAELEQELKQVHEVAIMDKKKLEGELAEEKRKTQEANVQFNTANIDKIEILHQYLSCRAEVFTLSVYCWCVVDFHRREVEAGGQELKRVMKETVDSEYAISQKLAYEK